MPPIRSASYSSTESDVRDARVASEDSLTFVQENILVTGRRVLAKHRRGNQGPYLFEVSTKNSLLEIATTESTPAMMVRRQRPGPIYRPPTDDIPFERRRGVRTTFPHERCNDATAARFCYTRRIPSQAGPARRISREIIVVDDSDDESEVIIVEDSDNEYANNPRDDIPADIAPISAQVATSEDGHEEEDEEEAAVNAALADLDAAAAAALGEAH